MIVELFEGIGIESVQQRPFGGVNLIAVTRFESQAAFQHTPSLSAHLAALGGAEARQIAVEIATARVDPVELHVVTDQQALALQHPCFVVVRQGHVP